MLFRSEEEEEEPAGAGTGAEAEQVVGGLAAVLGVRSDLSPRESGLISDMNTQAADLLLTAVGGNPNRNQGINTAITQLFNLTHQAEQAGNFVRTQVQAADTLGQTVWKLFGLNPPPSLLGGGAAQTGNQTTLFGLG